MNKLSFQQKLWVPLLCSLLCITAIFLFETIQTRNVRMDERQNDLRSLDDLALNIVKQYGDKAAAGTLSKEDAQKQAMDLIRGLRYAKDGYFTISSGTKSLMHPIKPENNGKDLVDLKDPKGTYVYRAIAATGAMPEGGGFVSYYWSRPGSNEPVPKMSRVVHYEPWGWDLVTGVYTDDIDTAFRESLLVSAGWLALVCVLLWVVVSLVNKSLRHTIGGDPEYVGEVTRTIAEGDLSVDVKVHESDQGSILHSVKSMQQRAAETIREIRHSADTIATASGEIASGNMDCRRAPNRRPARWRKRPRRWKN
jgi:methyl-accepting chemotaxis protein